MPWRVQGGSFVGCRFGKRYSVVKMRGGSVQPFTYLAKNRPKSSIDFSTMRNILFGAHCSLWIFSAFSLLFIRRRLSLLFDRIRPMPDTGITYLLWGICLHPQPSLKLSHASYTIFAPKSATHGGYQNFGPESQYIDAVMPSTTICWFLCPKCDKKRVTPVGYIYY